MMRQAWKGGRCATGGQRGTPVLHLLQSRDSHAPALCGTTPGRLSVGWDAIAPGEFRRCRTCQKRIDRLFAFYDTHLVVRPFAAWEKATDDYHRLINLRGSEIG